MPLESYLIWLRVGLFLHVTFVQQGGEVVSFAVVLVAEAGGGRSTSHVTTPLMAYPTGTSLAEGKVCSTSTGFPMFPLVACLVWQSQTSRRIMKIISASTTRTSRRRVPPLPRPLRRGSRTRLTSAKARQIIQANGGRAVTEAEQQQLMAAGLWGLPED